MKRIFIIGGGPSLKGFDFTAKGLMGEYTIGCNDAAFLAKTSALFSLDSGWMLRSADRIRAFRGEKFLACSAVPAEIPPASRVRYYGRKPEWDLSAVSWVVGGDNSGHGAVNLAYHLGASEIHCLGFDFQGYRWYPGDHHRCLRNHYQEWAARLDACAALLAEKGVRLIVYGQTAMQHRDKRSLQCLM